jgi:hypothetical protein
MSLKYACFYHENTSSAVFPSALELALNGETSRVVQECFLQYRNAAAILKDNVGETAGAYLFLELRTARVLFEKSAGDSVYSAKY